jgi:hypothetical protein
MNGTTARFFDCQRVLFPNTCTLYVYTSVGIGRARDTEDFDHNALVHNKVENVKAFVRSSVRDDVSRRERVTQESLEQNKCSLRLERRHHMTSRPHRRQREAPLVLLNKASNLHPAPRPNSQVKVFEIAYESEHACLSLSIRRLITVVYLAVRGVPGAPLFGGG